MPTPEGYDACLGKLPDVVYACCGHGITEKAYRIYKGVDKMKDDKQGPMFLDDEEGPNYLRPEGANGESI